MEWLVIIGYGFSLLVICLFSLGQFNLAWHYRKQGHKKSKTQSEPTELPIISVQLPIYNEKYVIERLIDAVAAFDYPKDKLEIQILEKRIKEARVKIDSKKLEIEKSQEVLDERSKDLDTKKSELEVISSESEGEEEKLLKDREKAAKNIEERYLKSYNKVRANMRNGLAVVPVRRGACGGCFNVVPPQKQAEIREKKKIIVCEHCGRILADVVDEIINEPVKKTTRRRKKSA